MPLKTFQQNYWLISDTKAPPPTPPSRGGYPGWQAVIIASLFGALWDAGRAALAKWRWVWTLVTRIRGLDRDRQLVVQRTLEMVEHQNYPMAQAAVRQTATTIGFNRPDAWRPLSHVLKRDQGQAENVYRHMQTVELLQVASRASGSTLTNPELHFLSELAYQSFAIRGR